MERASCLKPITIDVVVPTFHADPSNLKSILGMDSPEEIKVTYYIIIDNPRMSVPCSNYRSNERKNVHFLRNDGNFGASASRNRGIDIGTSDFILFLDEDIIPSTTLLQEYKAAIETDPIAPGFVGTSRFPDPVNLFTRGTVASDILTFWSIAETRRESGWGITANLLVRRNAIGDVRFSQIFPKRGGGEDIDFCLRIVENTGMLFRTASRALVHHPWWDRGSPQYRRFARWAFGDGRLPQLHNRFRYYNAPNLVETLALGVPLLVLFSGLGMTNDTKPLEWLGLVGLAEFAVEIIRLGTKGTRKSGPLTSIEATLVRISNDIGRLAGNLKRTHFLGFGERFDYFTTGESIRYERKVACAKFLVFLIGTVLVMLL